MVSGEGRGRKEGAARLPILIPVLCACGFERSSQPPSSEHVWRVTRLLVVLGSKNELPSEKPALGIVAAVPSRRFTVPPPPSPPLLFLGPVFGLLAPRGQLRVGVGGRPRLPASLAPLSAARRGCGLCSVRGRPGRRPSERAGGLKEEAFLRKSTPERGSLLARAPRAAARLCWAERVQLERMPPPTLLSGAPAAHCSTFAPFSWNTGPRILLFYPMGQPPVCPTQLER